MGVVRAKIQTVEDIYQLIWTAVASKRPIEASYDRRPRLFCPHRLGKNQQGQLRVLCYQYGGQSKSGLQPAGSPANWRCLVLEKLSKVKVLDDAWRTAPNHSALPPVQSTRILTPRIIPKVSRKTDSERVARAGSGQFSSAAWRSNSDYAARGERDDPRGRKSGGGSGADNPTWPMRAEGEKRVRSATRNPYAAMHSVA